MFASLRTMSASGWLQLARWTVLGTCCCLAVSLVYNWLAFRGMEADALRQGLISAAVLPIILAGPLFFYLTLKLRELAVANHRLEALASMDELTNCLNRRAFSAQVESWLSEGKENDRRKHGALMVIDADNFKAINDTHGHQQGDVALKLIADAIAAASRRDDFVGRLGGEEFGVFLPGAEEMSAADVAERIRSNVSEASFVPDGRPYPLAVSVGCAVFDYRAMFSELYRLADERLYDAKKSGRNRVMLASIADDTVTRLPTISLH